MVRALFFVVERENQALIEAAGTRVCKRFHTFIFYLYENYVYNTPSAREQSINNKVLLRTKSYI